MNQTDFDRRMLIGSSADCIPRRDDAGSAPRTPDQALETAPLGNDSQKGLQF